MLAAALLLIGTYDTIAEQIFPHYDLPTVADVASWWDWKMWIILLLIVILIAIIVGISPVLRKLHIAEGSSPSTIEHTMFYGERLQAPQLTKQFKGATELWLFWHIGTVGWAEDIHRNKAVTRLVLIDPTSSAFSYIAGLIGDPENKLSSEVRKLTRDAHQHGLRPRWFRGFMNPITIGDPHSDTGQAFVQYIVPYEIPHQRPSLLVKRSDNEELFNRLVTAYDKVWEESREPKPEELQNDGEKL